MNETERIDFLESIGSIPGALAAVACLFLVGWGAGRLLRFCLRDSRPTELANEMVYAVAGLNLIALGGVCLGSLGLLVGNRRLWLLAVLGMLAMAAIVYLARDALRPRWIAQTSYLPAIRPIYFLSVPLAVLTLGPALCYPCGWDELVYHGVLPRRWNADGWPAYYPDIPYSGFPSLVEILCWLVAPIEALITSRLLVWISWIAGLWLLHDILNRSSRRESTAVVTLSLAACPTSLMISANCYVEAILFLQLAAIFAVLKLQTSGTETQRCETVFPVLLGVLVGGAAAVKLTSVIFLCIPFVWFTSNSLGNRTVIRWLRPLVICVATAVLVALPFYVRPWILSGNPVFPFFAGWFTADADIIESSQYHHAIGGSVFGMRGILAFLTTPFLIAFDAALYDGSFGWQFIGLMGLAAIGLAIKQAATERRRTIEILILGAIFYVFWFFTAQQARFALSAVAAVTFLAARGFLALDSFKRRIATAMLAVASVISLPWSNASYYFAAWETLIGIWNQTQYVDDSTGGQYAALLSAIDQQTTTQAKILLVFEHRSLYILRPCTIGTPFFQSKGLMPPNSFESPIRLMNYLQENAFTHVVLALGPVGPDQSSAWWDRVEPLFKGFEACVQSGTLTVEWASEQYLLLEVN